MQRMNLYIEGMSCGHCVASVRQALERLEAVEVERVAVGPAAVRFDPARSSASLILDAIARAGYEARVAG